MSSNLGVSRGSNNPTNSIGGPASGEFSNQPINNLNISNNSAANNASIISPTKEIIKTSLIKKDEVKENADPNLASPNTKNNATGAQAPANTGLNQGKQRVITETAKTKFQLSSTNNVTSLQRSYLFTNNDRYNKEQQIMQPLKSGGGLLGLKRIILEEKVKMLNLDKSKVVTDSQMLERLRIDGVYVNDPQIHQKFTDINVQKLEERLLREGKTNYFKINGELKLHNDILADEITRPADLAFEQSEAYQQKVVNSILSDRMHSFKKRYYRLDIVVGKISLLKYPTFFSAEDKEAIELREIYKDYERRTSLAMIPFYMSRLEFIENEQHNKRSNPHITPDELEFLEQNRDEAQRKLDQEKREVQELATQLYEKWQKIKELRKLNQYASSNVKMKVHKDEMIGDFYFNLMHEEPSSQKYNGSALPSSEINRRNNAMKIRAYIRLIINGKYVSRTRKAFLKWPNYEIEVSEQFQVHLFTMPSSMQLEIVIGTFKEFLVDVIDVEIPGQYVKALTSASSLVKEVSFSKYDFDKKRLNKQILQVTSKPGATLTKTQTEKFEKEQKKLQLQEEKAQDNDVKGIIYIKAEWKGEGPRMPPMRSENLFKSGQAQKLRKEYNEDEQQRMILRQLYIDVNDPRNEKIIKFIKETKNEFLIRLLNEDSKNANASLLPFRHKLMEARSKDPLLAKIPIPLLESEIIDTNRSKFFLDQLEVLFREQAYREYLEKRADQDKLQKQTDKDQRAIQLAEFITFDTDSIRRRQKFFDMMKQKQKEIKAGNQRASTQYKSIVREFELFQHENPFTAIFNKIFISGRKLRPLIKKRQPVALDTVKEAKIMVHVIKGYRVPVRSQVFKQVHQLKQRTQQMDPYNRNLAGPTARTPQSLLMQQPGYMGGAGIGQFDQMRQTYGVGNSMGGMNNMNMSGRFGNNAAFGSMGGFGGSGMYGGNQMMGGMGNGGLMPRQIGGDIEDYNRQAISQMKDLYRIARVETFVEVRVVYNEFYTEVKTTNIAEGDFPEWNEVLNFALESENKKKFTKEELVNSNAMLYISLFDREITPYKEDEFSSAQIKMQIEYRFLGSFSIPLTSILHNPPKMEAMFKVNRPLALFNYVILKENIFLMDDIERQSQSQRTNEELNTYITLSISLDPVLELPSENDQDYYPGEENPVLLFSATDWIRGLRASKQHESRHYLILGENISGHSILISRFLTEQAPPEDVCNLESYRNDDFAIEKAARYVSLIPHIDDNKALMDMPDLYCTSQEFLDLGAGDDEEHAILLCNYFNYIDKIQRNGQIKSYLLLGRGTPEGKTAYVLRRDVKTNFVEIWNPMRGEAYYFGRQERIDRVGCLPVGKGYSMDIRLNDPTCQLKSVGTIIGPDNVWANISSQDEPALLNYDLDNKAHWKSFFTKQNFTKYFPNNEISTIQPPLIYSEPQGNHDDLAIRIQKYISQKFQDERIREVKMTTKWNVAISDKLIDILFHCELHKLKSRQGGTNSTLRSETRQNADEDLDVSKISDKIRKATEEDAHGQRAWGFPINTTFVTLDLLWEEVKNTKLHAVMDRNAEFSLSVYVKGYSNNVLSVWLYLAAFTKQRVNI